MSGTTVDFSHSSDGTKGADRVADILLLFMHSNEPLGVSEIARRLNLSKAVAHRVLQSLTSRGLTSASADPPGYCRGPAMLALGAQPMSRQLMRTMALPEMEQLRDVTAETVTLSVAVNTIRIYVDQVQSLSEVRVTVTLDRPRPLHAGASGKAILAFLDPVLREQVLRGRLDRLTAATVVDRRKLRAELRRIEQTRVSLSLGERNRDAGSVASPIFGPGNHLVGAVSVCSPIHRMDEEAAHRFAPPLLAAADNISTLLRDASTAHAPHV